MTVRELRLSAGAGFVVVVMGNIMTMPGLPKKPAAEGIDVDENGVISGLFLSAFWQTPHKKAYANSALQRHIFGAALFFCTCFPGALQHLTEKILQTRVFGAAEELRPERPPP